MALELPIGRDVAFFLVFGLGILCYALAVFQSRRPPVRAPFVGRRRWWEPTFLVRLRFVRGSVGIIAEGYRNVR